MTFNSNKPKVLGLVWFVLRLYSFSIFISCTHFLFLSIFLFGIIFCFVFPFIFLFLFYDNHQQIERESVLWCDKSVVVGPTCLIFFFFTKMSLYLFLRKWKHQKAVFSFFKSYFFWILKMKIEYKYKYKAKQVFYQCVEQEIENKYKIYPFFAQTK